MSNDISKLDQAMGIGECLRVAGVDYNTADTFAQEYSRGLYYKPRARRYRNLFCFHIMKGYQFEWWSENTKDARQSYSKWCHDNVHKYMSRGSN